jgi:serine/threonine-protein kinase
MEYLDGANLEDLVQKHGRLAPERVVHVLRQICGSLAEAHAAGLIHRDIKPANIVLCERGGAGDVVKVLDFGLVKSVTGEAGLATSTDNAAAGTPLFMPPEAIVAPQNVDARSDLYAVGCVGYYLLTGTHVFEANALVEVLTHHLHTKPTRPSERCKVELPEDLEAAILWCLEKSRDDRPPDARALADRLAATSVAGSWTESRALAWWRLNHGSMARLATANTVAVDRSLVVDLAARGRP